MSLFATYTYDNDIPAPVNGGAVPNKANGVIKTPDQPIYTTSDTQGGSAFAVKATSGSGGQLTYNAPNATAWTGSLYVTVDHNGSPPTEITPDESTQLVVFAGSDGTNLAQIEMRTGYAFDIAVGSTKKVVPYSVSCVCLPIGRQFRIDWQVTYTSASQSMIIVARIYADLAEGRQTNPATGNPAASGTITAEFGTMYGNGTLPVTEGPAQVTVGANKGDWPVTFDTFRMWTDTSVWPDPYGTPTPTLAHTWVGDPDEEGFIVTGMTVNCDTLRLAVSPNSDMSQPITYFTPDRGQEPATDWLGNPDTWTGQPDDYGWFRFTVTGLAADTTYYYQIANTPYGGGTESLIGSINSTNTLPPAGSPQNFKVALSSCTRSNSVTPFAVDDIRTVFQPHFFIHLGDFHYSGGAFDTSDSEQGGDTSILTATVDHPENPMYHEQTYRAQISNAAGLSALCATVPMFYMISDHEYSSNNGDTSYYDSGVLTPRPEILGNLRSFLHSVPYRSLVDPTTARYRSWVVGRIRFILIDIRTSERQPGEDFDPSQGTPGQYPPKAFLGDSQKAWFKEQLQMSEPLKVVLSDTAYLGGQPGDDGYGNYNSTSETAYWDKWANYATERQEIADFITTETTIDGQPIRVDMWHGDSHLLGTAKGTDNPNGLNNVWGGFSVLCGSPLDQHGIGNFQGYFDQTFNNGGTGSTGGGPICSQYFRITITDDGSTITRLAEGYGYPLDPSDPNQDTLEPNEGQVWITQSVQWDTTEADRSGEPKVYNGTEWAQHPVKIYEGPGSDWIAHPAKGYDGTDWIESK